MKFKGSTLWYLVAFYALLMVKLYLITYCTILDTLGRSKCLRRAPWVIVSIGGLSQPSGKPERPGAVFMAGILWRSPSSQLAEGAGRAVCSIWRASSGFCIHREFSTQKQAWNLLYAQLFLNKDFSKGSIVSMIITLYLNYKWSHWKELNS